MVRSSLQKGIMPVRENKHFTAQSRGSQPIEDTPTIHQKASPEGVASDQIRTVTSGTYKELVLEGKGPIVVEFMSYGCVHCRALEPILRQVAEMLKSKEEIFRVNTAVEQDLADSYEVQGTPTLIMFLQGREVGRAEGPSPTVASVLAAVTQPFES
jgi:thioredoxin 1